MPISYQDLREIVFLELALSRPVWCSFESLDELRLKVARASLKRVVLPNGTYVSIQLDDAYLLAALDLGHVPALVPILLKTKKGPARNASGPV